MHSTDRHSLNFKSFITNKLLPFRVTQPALGDVVVLVTMINICCRKANMGC